MTYRHSSNGPEQEKQLRLFGPERLKQKGHLTTMAAAAKLRQVVANLCTGTTNEPILEDYNFLQGYYNLPLKLEDETGKTWDADILYSPARYDTFPSQHTDLMIDAVYEDEIILPRNNREQLLAGTYAVREYIFTTGVGKLMIARSYDSISTYGPRFTEEAMKPLSADEADAIQELLIHSAAREITRDLPVAENRR